MGVVRAVAKGTYRGGKGMYSIFKASAQKAKKGYGSYANQRRREKANRKKIE